MSTLDAQPPVHRPVAAVVVDSPLPHLDRLFEYAVPAHLAEVAQPGVRVRIRFSGREIDGFVVERRERPEHDGRLADLGKVVSPEPVLTPEVLAVCRTIADRYAGVLGDVLRLAVPKRHATAERALPLEAPVLDPVPTPDAGPWAAYPAGPALLRRVHAGEAPRAAWLALPGQVPERDWPRALAVAAATALASDRGALLVMPDHRDVQRVDGELTALLGPGRHVRLTADQGPQARYTAWLKLLRGHVRCVVGTRAAVFAPVHDLGLVAWWDDGDDLLLEPRAPYPAVREVLLERSRVAGAALVSGGFASTVAVQRLVDDGVLAQVRAAPSTVRAAAPAVVVAGEGLDEERDGPAARAHLPSAAWRAAQAALPRGPVLVQVPRRGYLPALSCQDCRTRARCPACGGPLTLPGPGQPAECRWCAASLGPAGFECSECGGRRLRSSVVGARRTAEELGRAFPGAPVLTSGAGEVLASVDETPALVIATPGAEPVATGGYAAALLLDAWALLDRTELDAPVEALRRWAGAAALVRGSEHGGVVVLAGVPAGPSLPPVEALIRWDPAWLAERELADRREIGLPPVTVLARLTAPRRALVEALDEVAGQLGAPVAERLGPRPLPAARGAVREEGLEQALLRVPADRADDLARALRAVRAVRSARKDPHPLSVQLHWPGGE